MKKLLLMCCIALGVSTLCRAQGGGGGRPPQQTPEQRVAALKTALALTDDQVTKITAIYKAQANSMDSFQKSGSQDFAAMRPIMTAATAKINAVLTPDQQAKFAAMPRPGRGGGGGGGGGTPPPPQR